MKTRPFSMGLLSTLIIFLLVLPAGAEESQDRLQLVGGSGTEIQVPLDLRLSELSLAQALELSEYFARQDAEESFLKRAEYSTYLLPGLGHLQAQDKVGGVLFMAGDILLSAGILLGFHALLPPSVQMQNLDYMTSSHHDIEQAWNNLTLKSMLPSIGVAVLGVILKQTYKSFVSSHAKEQAEKVLREGRVQFEIASQEELLARMLGWQGR